VVQVRRSRLEYGAVEVAIIMRRPDGRYTHRRMSCAGNNLLGARGHFFDQDPQALARAGRPSAPRRVQDRDFATIEQALEAAQAPAADPEGWMTRAQFEDPDDNPLGAAASWLEPEAMRVGAAGLLLACLAGLAVFAAVVWAGIAQGVDFLEGKGPWEILLAYLNEDENAPVGPLVILAALFIGGFCAFLTAELLRHRNLAKEREP
jgi:hypothetical protein